MPSTPDREDDPRYETTIGLKPITDKIERRKVAQELQRSIIDEINGVTRTSTGRIEGPVNFREEERQPSDSDTITKEQLDSMLDSMRGDLNFGNPRFPVPGVVSEAWKRAATAWRNAAIIAGVFVIGSILTLTVAAVTHGREVARLENTIDAKEREITDLKVKLADALYADYLKLTPATDAEVLELNEKIKAAK